MIFIKFFICIFYQPLTRLEQVPVLILDLVWCLDLLWIVLMTLVVMHLKYVAIVTTEVTAGFRIKGGPEDRLFPE